jgi:uncharacterized protein (TIGR02996 family)
MTDGKSLLAAVIAAPDDDGVRLVYADWLEEHGDLARAEFIRTQIERYRLKQNNPKQAALAAREKELLALHAPDWLRHLPDWDRPRERQLVADEYDWFGFRRGFLQGVTFPGVERFLTEAPTVFTAEPITHFYISDANALPRLSQSPEFLGLIGLRFGHYTLGDEGAVHFSRLPAMPRLRQLWMYKQEMGNRGLRALCRWPGLATVEDLELGFNNFQAAAIKALIASPYLAKLKRLDLSDSLIATATKKALKERFGKVVEV